MRGNLPVPSMPSGTYRDYPAPVTYLHAAQRQPREDALPTRWSSGWCRPARASDGWRRAGRRGRRQGVRPHVPAAARLARRDRQGRRGHQGADRQQAVVAAARARRAGQGSARARPPSAVAVRRAAGAAARAVTNAASVAIALPGRLGGARARGDRGVPARRLHVHDVQEEGRRRADERRPATVVVLCPSAREEGVRPAFEEAQVVAGGRRGDPRLGQHAARGLHAAGASPTRSRPR